MNGKDSLIGIKVYRLAQSLRSVSIRFEVNITDNTASTENNRPNN